MDYKVSYRKKDKGIQCIIAYKDGDKWKQRTKQGFSTQKESKSWQDEVLEELRETIKVPTEYRGLTFGEFKKIFLEDKKREYTYNSTDFYNNAFAKFEDLNDLALIEIGYIDIKPCVDKMVDEGLKESSIKDYLGKIRTVFNHAIENYEIMKDNPVKIRQHSFSSKKEKGKKVTKLVKTEKIKALTKNELDSLLSKMSGSDYYFTLIASKCGLRLGEINGLTSGSFDFKSRKIKVRQQWKRIGYKEYDFGSLKTENSYRDVPIPKSYVPELREYVRTCVKDMNNRIFIDYNNDVVGGRLNRRYKELGFDISVHDLRHTYATTLLANNFDYKTIAKFMGDTVETVIKVYSHFTDDMLKSAEERIDNIL